MTIPLVSKPEFPNVPDVQGVPAVPRDSGVTQSTTTFSSVDGGNIPSDGVEKIWGIFDADNELAITVDTFTLVNPKNASKISDMPVEEGGYASYNKVQSPNEVKVKVSLGGNLTAMADLLSTLRDIKNSTNLFSVVTPYETYLNMDLENFDYSQQSKNGSGRLDVELKFKEVREVEAQFTTVKLPAAKVKNPASASNVQQGKKQAKTSGLTGLVNGVTNWAKR